MTRVRFTEYGGQEFGFDIHVPDGKAISFQKVLSLCSDYLRTLASLTHSEYENFSFAGGTMRIEFDKDDSETKE